jgi:mannose-6-phosphate isomerase-like protein (cupin superfamily)
MERFDTMTLADSPMVTAPDGSTVRPLCQIAGAGSFAVFELGPGEVARAVSHATVQEIWYVVAGTGQIWRRQGDREETVPLAAGVCLSIPLGTRFQFRSAEADEPLRIAAVTMPPWPTDSVAEARFEAGPWPASTPDSLPS